MSPRTHERPQVYSYHRRGGRSHAIARLSPRPGPVAGQGNAEWPMLSVHCSASYRAAISACNLAGYTTSIRHVDGMRVSGVLVVIRFPFLAAGVSRVSCRPGGHMHYVAALSWLISRTWRLIGDFINSNSRNT